jgi:hypothetical protein
VKSESWKINRTKELRSVGASRKMKLRASMKENEALAE